MKKKIRQDTKAFIINGEQLSCKILYSRRRTASISVHPDFSVIVRAPLHSNKTELEMWVQAKIPWITKHLSEFRKRSKIHKKYLYVNGEKQLLLGEYLTLKIQNSVQDCVEIRNTEIKVSARKSDSIYIRKLIEAELKKKAQTLFSERLNICHLKTSAYFLPFPSLRLRWMKSRWGSCSFLRGVTLNIHLIRMPLELIDYVIFHELCHLRVPNHGPDFYRIMTDLVPDWKVKNDLLRRYGDSMLAHA